MTVTSERIKALRESQNLTQSELARKLGLTRGAVNAWEMGFSVPSTQYLKRLADLFSVSTDYLLCIDRSEVLDLSGLTGEDKDLLIRMANHLRNKNC